MFVTYSKRRIGTESFKHLTEFKKTGTLPTLAPLKDQNPSAKNICRPKVKSGQKGKISATLFRKYYLRGDFPVSISFTGAQRTLKWLIDPKNIDLAHYLPLFIEGLIETEEPFAFISEKTSLQAISANGDKLTEILPDVILPLKKALDSTDPLIIVRAIKVFQALFSAKVSIAQDLVPYYKNLLPCFNKHFNENKNLGHHMEFSQKDKQNIGDLIMETLGQLEANGGPEAFAHIKYMIPVYQSAKHN